MANLPHLAIEEIPQSGFNRQRLCCCCRRCMCHA